MAEEVVVLVDPKDNEVGTAPKMAAHREGRLHRAVSVFVLNAAGEMLLQRRALGKYHSSGLWSNACCSHPRPGENPHQAARRRLKEEMGLDYTVDHLFSFIYRAELDAGLTEHELDHVYLGIGDADPVPDPEEVVDWRWVGLDELKLEMEEHPERFTAWFPLALPHVLEALAKRGG
jgi:isopentenyl-diphosphate Delta-isomerase